MGTYQPKVRRGKVRWRTLDAEGRILGRLASRAARVLAGKERPDYTPHIDPRDGIIIINAEKVRLTGKKLDQKFYRHYTGYPGGLREASARALLASHPERLLRDAIRGMLPKTRLGEQMARRLKVYAGPTHPHASQNPEQLSFDR